MAAFGTSARILPIKPNMKVYNLHSVTRSIKPLLLFVFVGFLASIIFTLYCLPNLEYLLKNGALVHDVKFNPWEKIDWHDEEFIRMENEREGEYN